MQTNNKNSVFNITSGFSMDVYDLGDLILKNRFAEALQAGVSRYPIYRSLNFAARLEMRKLMDDLALNLGLVAQRFSGTELLLEGEGVFITARGSHKPRYSSCAFSIWASDIDRAEQARAAILARVGDARITEPMFSIDWHFVAPRGGVESAHIEELADDVLIDAAYPELEGGVANFIDGFLKSPEAVLVLQGAPGTGKTRLIRAILGEISRRDGDASALYTGDTKALESDALFVKFITGWDDVFVIEDADHLLKPRSEGNEHLHRFLTIADGVVRAQGRKIIFSTNLPNIGDLDDALVRPGRCHARVNVRELTPDEAVKVLVTLCGSVESAERARLALPEKRSYSLAELYKAASTATQSA